MIASDIIVYLIVGGILGIVGQSTRVLIGLKKMKARNEIYEPNRMFVSIVIGFTAGVLGILSLLFANDFDGLELFEKDIMLLITFGYAGVDFIEGFFRIHGSKIPSDKNDMEKLQKMLDKQRFNIVATLRNEKIIEKEVTVEVKNNNFAKVIVNKIDMEIPPLSKKSIKKIKLLEPINVDYYLEGMDGSSYEIKVTINGITKNDIKGVIQGSDVKGSKKYTFKDFNLIDHVA